MKLENNKAWPSFKHLITEKQILKYKSLEDVKKHIEYSSKPDYVYYELNGTNLTLYYEYGKLKHTVTQGSEYGEDILDNALDFKGVIDSLDEEYSKYPNIIIKGTTVISNKNFEYISNDYANCRYAAAGISRRLDCENIELLEFIANKVYVNENGKFKELDYINTSLFLTVKNKFNMATNLLENGNIFENLLNKNLEYSISGIIYKNKDYELVYKISSQEKSTIVTDYEWRLSKTNKLIPIMHFQPVEIDGSTITKASLLCAGLYAKLNAPVGSTIKVTKANGILPHVESVVERSSNELEMPKVCPECGSTLTKYKNHLICINNNCSNILFSKCLKIMKSLKVLRFNDVIIEGLINRGILKSIKDLFTLKPEDIMGIKLVRGYVSNKAAINLLETLNEKLKNLDEQTFISLLNLYKITKFIANTIEIEAKQNNKTLLEVFENCDVSVLGKVIKPQKIKTIMNYMNNNKEEYYTLKHILLESNK